MINDVENADRLKPVPQFPQGDDAQQGPPPRPIEEVREWNDAWTAGYAAAHRDQNWRTFQEVRDENAKLRAELEHTQAALTAAARERDDLRESAR